MAELSNAEIAVRYRDVIADSAGVTTDDLERWQTLILPEQERAESELAVAYHVGAPTLIRTDPSLADRLAPLASASVALTSQAIRDRVADIGFDFINGGDQHLLSAGDLRRRPLPDGSTMRRLDGDAPADRAMIVELLQRCDPEDVDAGELEVDDIDPFAIGVIDDSSGLLGALASARPWTPESIFDDIGIITATEHRAQGWGSYAVSTLCRLIFEHDRLPVYRNNWDNPASKGLARAVGFHLAGHLTAIGPAAPTG